MNNKMEFTKQEQERMAVHEAGHCVCGYLLGGLLRGAAVSENTEETLGLTHCDFPQPWQTGAWSEEARQEAMREFYQKSICHAYAGSLAEEIILGQWPLTGNENDFKRIGTLMRHLLTLHPEQDEVELMQRIEIPARSQTKQLLLQPHVQHAIRVLAETLQKRRWLEGAETTEIIEAALQAGRSQ